MSTPNDNGANVITHLKCCISGHAFTPSSDIAVTPSGHVCEKRLLLSKLTENGGIDPFDPSHTLSLSEKDLITLSTSTSASASVMPPRPASASSLPNLLHMMQEEYDNLMLELFDTRNALEETRKELSQSLYQNDAAVRVIARLTMERDHARQKLADFNPSTANTVDASVVVETEPTDMEDGTTEKSSKKRKVDKVVEVEGGDTSTKSDTDDNNTKGIPEVHVNAMVSKWKEVSKARRKKAPPPANHATKKDISDGYAMSSKLSLHKSSGKAGINCVVVKDNWVITGANDKAAIVYDINEQKEIANLTGANKEITCVNSIISKNLVLTAAADGKVRVYQITSPTSSDWTLLDTIPLEKFNNKQSPLVGLDVQPTETYFLATSQAGEIAFCAIHDQDDKSPTVEHLCSFHAKEGIQYTCTSIHPDGLILGAGTENGTIELWDLRNQALVMTVTFSSSSTSKITSLSFSENGYYLLSSNSSGEVHVYDIRKIGSDKSLIATLNVQKSDGNEDGYVGPDVSTVAFDPCGKFVAYGGGQNIVVVQVKEWDTVLTRINVDTVDGKMISSFAWNNDAKGFVSVSSKERVTRFWNKKDDNTDVKEG